MYELMKSFAAIVMSTREESCVASFSGSPADFEPRSLQGVWRGEVQNELWGKQDSRCIPSRLLLQSKYYRFQGIALKIGRFSKKPKRLLTLDLVTPSLTQYNHTRYER